MKMMDRISSFLSTSWERLYASLFQRRLDREFDQEVRIHLSLLTEENLRRGMTPEEARYAALRSFGNVTQVREDNRQRRGLYHLDVLGQDLRYGLHTMRKNPAFAVIAVLTLALGTGANTAIFQLLDAVRIRTLPVANPQELVEIKLTGKDERRGSVNRFGQLTNPIWEQIRDHAQGFDGMLAIGDTQLNLTNGGEARYARAIMVSGDFFHVLGIRPALGRVFTPDDDRKGCGTSSVVISHAFWQREFGGNPAAIGTTLSLNSQPMEIVGVTPPEFFGFEVGQSYDVAIPLCAEPTLHAENSYLANGTMWWLMVVARMKPGSSLAAVNAQLDAMSPAVFDASLPPKYPTESIKSYLGFKLAASPVGAGISKLRNDYSASLYLLLGASGLVLLIACANLANLLLARTSAREREIAVRLALGASRPRILRQLMTESLLLAGFGSLLGLWLAKGLSRLLVSFLEVNGDTIFLDLAFDWRVLIFNAGLAILTCLLFGSSAALRATATAPGAAMKAGNRTTTAGRQRFGLRRMLVVAQVSLSFVLLAGALLFERSLHNLLTLDPGFRQKGVLVAALDFRRMQLPKERRLDYQRLLVTRIQAIPGIQAAAATDIIPIGGDVWGNDVWMEGSSQRELALFNRAGPDYFKAMQVPVVAGRPFDARDTAGSLKVAIVNQAFAEKFTHGANPIGQRFWKQQTPHTPQTLYEIVGLVPNTKYWQLREDFRPIAYLASAQDDDPDSTMQLLLRSDLALADASSAIKHALAEINPGIVMEFDSLASMIDGSLLRERLVATLSGFFGLLAVLLATIGLYGVISYMVARRTNEIGIRMALGADRLMVVSMIMREAVVLLAIGLGVGIALSWVAGTAANSLLFGLRTGDPETLTLAAALLAVVTLAASFLPSHRAARLDPLIALREE
jgi:predicted permease